MGGSRFNQVKFIIFFLFDLCNWLFHVETHQGPNTQASLQKPTFIYRMIDVLLWYSEEKKDGGKVTLNQSSFFFFSFFSQPFVQGKMNS